MWRVCFNASSFPICSPVANATVLISGCADNSLKTGVNGIGISAQTNASGVAAFTTGADNSIQYAYNNATFYCTFEVLNTQYTYAPQVSESEAFSLY